MSDASAPVPERDGTATTGGVARVAGAIHLGAAGTLHLAVGFALLALAASGRLRAVAFGVTVDGLLRTPLLTDTALLARWPAVETAAVLAAALSPLLLFVGIWQLVGARDVQAGRPVGCSMLASAVCSPVSAPLGVIAGILLWLGNRNQASNPPKPREAATVAGVLLLVYMLCLVPFAAVNGFGISSSTPADTGPDSAGDLGFHVVEAGLDYQAIDTFRGSNGMISNAGVYVLDYDGDGHEDVLLTGGEGPVLYRNTEAGFRRSSALPEIDGPVRGALAFDYDADGREDVFLTRPNESAVLLANRGGSFKQVENSLTRRFRSPVGATTADYDGNGCPDVLVFQYGDWMTAHPAGERNYTVPPGEDNGYRNRLFLGNCSGFEEATKGSGIQGTKWSLAASSVDLTGDGSPDIHVANDFNYDIVYVNLGNATFKRTRLGERTNRNGMSSEVADFTGDGRPDMFTTNIYFPATAEEEMATTMRFRADGNNLLVNRGNATFNDRAAAYGVKRGGWGWAAVAADLDNDGHRDLFHTTRNMSFRYADNRFSPAERNRLHAIYPTYRYPALFEGNGSGFTPRSAATAGFRSADGRGAAGFDYDRDGDMDLLVANAGGAYHLYKNTESEGHALQLDIRDATGGTAVGASVSVTTANRTRNRWVTARTDFLSQDSRTLHVGFAGTPRSVITVRWPDGTERTIADVHPGVRLVIPPEGRVRRVPFNVSADG